MSIRVVDNKKLDMTEDEFTLYQKICQSYTTMSNKGEDMFIDLFESNEAGVITFLKPPSKRHTSLEVFLFLMALMQHQHLRLMHQEVQDALNEMKKKKPAK
jgi:hypothetical protein